MQPIITKCECGKILTAKTESQAKYNLNLHKKSKIHKTNLEKMAAIEKELKKVE